MKIKNKQKDIFFTMVCIFTLILFFEPGLFKESKYVFIDTIYDYLKLLVSGIIFIKYFLYKYKNSNYSRSKIIILVCLYQFVCFLITFFNNGDLMRFIGPAITSVIVLMIVEMLIYNKSLFTSLKCLNIYFRLCFIINFITIIISFFSPESRFIYFYGIDNRFVFTYLSWMLTEALVDINENGKITKQSIIVFCLMELSLLAVNTVAAMITFLIWLIPLFIPKFKIMKKTNLIINSIFLFDIFIVRFRLSYAFNKLLTMIGKFPHLSGRVLIWDAVFDNISTGHFLFGIGMQSEASDMSFFRKYVSDVYAVNHAHNTFVDILYRFGFIGFVLFGAIIYITVDCLNKNKNNKYASVVLVSLIITLILGIFDTLLFAGFYLIVGIACNLDLLDNKKITKKQITK